MKKIRLNSFIAKTGLCSRRKADTLISEGKIEVNGRTVTDLGTKINPEKDSVAHGVKQLHLKEKHTYILLNKPEGYITTSKDERGRKIVLDLLPKDLRQKRLFSIGRLDRDSTGLLILTDDGELANKLMHPRNRIKKRYEVMLTKPFKEDYAKQLRSGIRDAGDLLKAHSVKMLKSTILEVTLTEGKKREIKRMFGGLGYGVAAIKRTKYAFLTLKGLEEGMYRMLTKQEIAQLKLH
jgi:23S rRNA pseudouridine2605 synthase